jgi:uncharacterized protein
MQKILKKTWINPKVAIRNSLIHGQGLFAKSKISKSEDAVIFGGIYTDTLGAHKAHELGKIVMQWDDDLYSYEDRGDDESYFINHSCNPNLWLVDAFTLVANRDIRSGEELTADYAMWEADEGFVSKWTCQCGSILCRRQVTGKDWRNPRLQKRYQGHFSPLINKHIQRLLITNEQTTHPH